MKRVETSPASKGRAFRAIQARKWSKLKRMLAHGHDPNHLYPLAIKLKNWDLYDLLLTSGAAPPWSNVVTVWRSSEPGRPHRLARMVELSKNWKGPDAKLKEALWGGRAEPPEVVVKVLRFLLKAGMPLNQSIGGPWSSRDRHLLESAIYEGHAKAFEFLLENGFPVEGFEKNGTPLKAAASGHRAWAAEALIAAGAAVSRTSSDEHLLWVTLPSFDFDYYGHAPSLYQPGDRGWDRLVAVQGVLLAAGLSWDDLGPFEVNAKTYSTLRKVIQHHYPALDRHWREVELAQAMDLEGVTVPLAPRLRM